MATRWNCPTRVHSGINGPSRMRKDDVRRYCIDCSVATGRLMERVSPAMERKRASRRNRAANRRDGIKFTHSVDGMDIRQEWDRLLGLDCWEEAWGTHVRRHIHRIELEVRGGSKGLPSGYYSHSDPKVHVTAGRAPGWLVSEVLLHELIHGAHMTRGLHRRASGRRDRVHDEAFHSMLLRAATEAYALTEAEVEAVRERYRKAGGARAAYSMDRALEGVLKPRQELQVSESRLAA